MNRLDAFLDSDGGPRAASWTMRSCFTPAETGQLVQQFTGQDLRRTTAQMLYASIPEQPTAQDMVGYLETTLYLRNQLLRDSDVLSMAHGLELRVPLVDRQLFESVSQIPASIRCERGKQLLLHAVPEVPDWIAGQPKRGFRFPFDRWITSLWRDKFEGLDQSVPFPLETWYRRWVLFTLRHFLNVNRIS